MLLCMVEMSSVMTFEMAKLIKYTTATETGCGGIKWVETDQLIGILTGDFKHNSNFVVLILFSLCGCMLYI